MPARIRFDACRYRDSLALWKHAVAADDDDGEAKMFLGEAWLKQVLSEGISCEIMHETNACFTTVTVRSVFYRHFPCAQDPPENDETISVLEDVVDRNLTINNRPRNQMHFYIATAYVSWLFVLYVVLRSCVWSGTDGICHVALLMHVVTRLCLDELKSIIAGARAGTRIRKCSRRRSKIISPLSVGTIIFLFPDIIQGMSRCYCCYCLPRLQGC